ncbi:MAG: fimbria/pilus outer membrane usher protein, partial [Vulcanimicrobiaceae bacterium]
MTRRRPVLRVLRVVLGVWLLAVVVSARRERAECGAASAAIEERPVNRPVVVCGPPLSCCVDRPRRRSGWSRARAPALAAGALAAGLLVRDASAIEHPSIGRSIAQSPMTMFATPRPSLPAPAVAVACIPRAGETVVRGNHREVSAERVATFAECRLVAAYLAQTAPSPAGRGTPAPGRRAPLATVAFRPTEADAHGHHLDASRLIPRAQVATVPTRQRPAVVEPPRNEELLVAVRLNNTDVTNGALIEHRPGLGYFVRASDLQKWRVNIPTNLGVADGAERFVDVSRLPGWNVEFDQSAMQLSIKAPATLFSSTTIDANANARHALMPTRSRGAFLDYDLHERGGFGGQSTYSGFYDLGLTLGQGVADNAFLHTAGGGSGSFVRLQTSWQRDDIVRRRAIRYGDGVSAGGAIGGGMRFGGLQLATDFSTDPSFIPYPTPAISGISATSSTIDVIGQGTTLTRQVPVGPFQIDNIPSVNGRGEIQVVVHDVLGGEHVITQSFYTSASQLKRGLSQYSYEAGFLRNDYALRSFGYGPFFIEGTHRYGLSDHVTGDAQFALQGSQRWLSLGASVLSTRLGVVGMSLTGGTGPSSGGRADLTYDYADRGFYFGAGVTASSPSFIPLGCGDPCTTSTSALQAHAGFPVGRRTSFGIAFSNQSSPAGPALRIASATLNAPLGRGQLIVAATRTAGTTAPTNSIGFFYAMQLGRRATLTTTATAAGSRSTSTVELQENLPPSGLGTAYHVRESRTAGGDQFDVTLLRQATTGLASLDVGRAFGQIAYDAEYSGAVALVGGRPAFTRSIFDSYGLVEVPGYPGVRVFANNQEIGRTNARGEILVPNLVRYQANDIRIDSLDLPTAANLGVTEMTVVPYAHSPVIARFPTKPAGGVLLVVRDSAKEPLAAGSSIRSIDGRQSWVVAYDGVVYLQGTVPGTLVLEGDAPSG